MPSYVVVGAQWGDEGKGKTVDFLAEKTNYVVRFQGGNNAGHTVIVNNEKFILHLLPSGVLHTNNICIIGSGVVINLQVFLKEIKELESRGLSTKHIFISDRAHLIMPYHILLDSTDEKQAGKRKIGTTQRGIGPCYSDKYSRMGIRVTDILDETIFANKLKEILEFKNKVLTNVYNVAALKFEDILNEFKQYIPLIKPRIVDSLQVVNKALDNNEKILFEGAQAMMLDIDFGTYPYVTSSSPTAGGITTGIGISPKKINHIIGVMKAYSTRVGEGPFVSELTDSQGDDIRKRGDEFGSTTGRPRRCGWLDTVVVKHAIMINGLDSIALTKLDILSHLDEIPVCVAYEIDGKQIDYIQANTEQMYKAKPVYKYFKGWKKSIQDISSFENLPQECKIYITEIEKILNCPIGIISVGPQRHQTLFKIKLDI